jgi:hypothetical protein
MSPLIKKTAIKFGLVLTAFSITSTFAIYVFNESWFISPWLLVFNIFAIITIAIVGVNQFKKGNGGFATFRESFSVFILPIIFQIVVLFGFNLLFYNVVDAELNGRNAKRQFELFMQEPDNNKDDMKKALKLTSDEEVESFYLEQYEAAKTAKGQLIGQAIWFVFFSILGLVVAAVTKKNRPEFD